MTRAGWIRLALVCGTIGALELASRMAWIDPIAFIPPSRMLVGAWDLLLSGQYLRDILLTLASAGLALLLSVLLGFTGGIALYRLPRVRRVLDPLLLSYYAVPIFIFYPMLIVLLGLNRWPLVAIGFLFAVVAMVVNTLNGLERIPQVLLKTARTMHLSRIDEIRLITLPASLPFIFTGIKLAVVYSFIAVIAGEFILSGSGFGYQIAFAYNNFDNETMYGLMLLLLLFVGSVNLILHTLEQHLYQRRVFKGR